MSSFVSVTVSTTSVGVVLVQPAYELTVSWSHSDGTDLLCRDLNKLHLILVQAYFFLFCLTPILATTSIRYDSEKKHPCCCFAWQKFTFLLSVENNPPKRGMVGVKLCTVQVNTTEKTSASPQNRFTK